MLTYRTTRSRVVTLGAAFAGAVAVLAAAGCSSSSSSSAPAPASSAPVSSATGSGKVDVLYAGSLVTLMTKQVGPAFQAATGYTVSGISAGSTDLATAIKGKVDVGDVFMSASPKADASLEGAANGSWVSWYGTFGTSPVVLGYNPKSSFAADLKSKPWYEAVTEPKIKVGFTDPATDPKGVLVDEALIQTAKAKKLPALTTLENDKDAIFPEETLVGRLQSGQLDAGFFYTAEATAAGIPYVPLTGVNLSARYTITILNKAPHEAGAEAFIKYLLSPAGQAFLKKDGFALVIPATVTGKGAPASLSSVLSS